MYMPARTIKRTSPPMTPPTTAPTREALAWEFDPVEAPGEGWGDEADGSHNGGFRHDADVPRETTSDGEILEMLSPTAVISYTPGVTLNDR